MQQQYVPHFGKSIIDWKIDLTLIFECRSRIRDDCSGGIASHGTFNLCFACRHDSRIKIDLQQHQV